MDLEESEHLENKLSLSERHEAAVSLAAFATANGGTVRFGINPDGKRIGMQVGRNTLEELANYFKQNLDPPQFPAITIEGTKESAVVTVVVEASPIKPVWAFGKPYKRVGRTNQVLSREETQRLVELTTGRTWDGLPCHGFGIDSVDGSAIENFLRRSMQDPGTATDTVLSTLGLRKGEALCNAAALLFAKDSRLFVSHAQVKCGRFIGTDSVDFLDEQTIYGNVFGQFDNALAFVRRNTRQGILITGRQPEREIISEYPEDAVREAIVNAICHREYSAVGTVQVRIYDDRLEVWNPGFLPIGLTIEALYREHPSVPRNPLLADALYRARVIEQWGTGTLRIIRACKERMMPQPEFHAEMGVFITRFRKKQLAVETPRRAEVLKRQRDTIAYVRSHGQISAKEYADLFGLSPRQARRDLETLTEEGILTRRGETRGTYFAFPEDPTSE